MLEYIWLWLWPLLSLTVAIGWYCGYNLGWQSGYEYGQATSVTDTPFLRQCTRYHVCGDSEAGPCNGLPRPHTPAWIDAYVTPGKINPL